MSNRIHLAFTAALTVALFVLAVVFVSDDAVADLPDTTAADGKDVILLRCETAKEFKVTAFEGSPAAPARRSDSCPEALSLLLKGGFEIRHVAHADTDAHYLVYTLLR